MNFGRILLILRLLLAFSLPAWSGTPATHAASAALPTAAAPKTPAATLRPPAPPSKKHPPPTPRPAAANKAGGEPVEISTPYPIPALRYEDYRSQVILQNPAFSGAQQQIWAAQNNAETGGNTYATILSADISNTQDARPNLNSLSSYSSITQNNASLGLSKQTSFGLKAELAYNYQSSQQNGLIHPQQNSLEHYTAAGPTLKLTQSLWQNRFGSLSQAQEASYVANSRASEYMLRYGFSQMLLDAERRYWALAVARELVRLQQENFQRAQQISALQARRATQRLVDQADALQAQAALKLRQLDLADARNREHIALRQLNDYRGQPPDTPIGALDLPDTATVAQLQLPQKGERSDVSAARYQLEASSASLRISTEQLTPTLDLYAMLGQGSFTPEVPGASSSGILRIIGVRFSSNLDFDAISATRQSAAWQKAGAQQTLDRTLQSQETDWQIISRQFEDARTRYTTMLELEQAQKTKLEAERRRYDQGRSTTYQILLFEQDYTSATLERMQTLSNLLTLRAQLRLFEEPPVASVPH